MLRDLLNNIIILSTPAQDFLVEKKNGIKKEQRIVLRCK